MSLGALVSSLTSSVEAGCPTFVLVDPLMGEPISVQNTISPGELQILTQAREQAWSRPVHVIKLAQEIELPLQLHPYLVELEGAADPWLVETAEIACAERTEAQADGVASSGHAAHRIGGWLQSSQGSSELTQTLSGMMRVNTEASTKARYQRMADRRVVDLLRHVVGDTRVAAQFGRIQRWSYLDACGYMAQLQSSNEVSTPLRLSRNEWITFMKGELLHPTVARWLGERARQPGQSNVGAPDARTLYAQANAALDRAEAATRRWPLRFAGSADRVAWAVLILLYPGIEQRPDVLDLLNATAEPDEPTETLHALSPMLNSLQLKATS